MIAFRLPPSAISTGHLRPLGFAKHLPAFGWDTVALSASVRAYGDIDLSSLSLIPDTCQVHRAFALDTARHLSIRGKYPAVLAQPDRWASWWPAAVCLGLRLIRRHQVRAIWSTYPIMTTHCVAYTLSRLTGLPWIADFRDPVASSVATQDKLTVSTQMKWERRVLSRARYSVFTTPSAMRSCADRYPGIHGEGRLHVIPNGFNEEDFAALPAYKPPQGDRPIHLVHGGVLYPSGRSPIPFFEALARLRDSGRLPACGIRVTLRACGSEERYGVQLGRLGLNEIVELATRMSYHDALAEQARADALLLFQGGEFDRQIPAKLYEYFRLGRPIFSLVGERGDTATALREAGGAEIVPIDDVSRIEEGLQRFLHRLASGRQIEPERIDATQWSRRQGASQLAQLLGRTLD